METGLVSSFNRPGGNVSGATFYSGALGAKQMEILSELAPKTVTFGILVNPNAANATSQVRDTQSAADTIGHELRVLNAGTEQEIDKAIEAIAKFRTPRYSSVWTLSSIVVQNN